MSAVDPISASFTAIEARLRTVFLEKKWDFHVVPDPMTMAEFKAIVRRTPCLALGWRQINPIDQKTGRRFQGSLGLRLTILVKNPNKGKPRFFGDERGPGLFPSIAGAAALLNGFSVPGLGTFFLTAIAQAYAEGYDEHDIAIATVDIGSTVQLVDIPDDPVDIPEFLRLLSTFEPWPDGQDRDGAYPVRQP